jgi:hypothetical protein
MWYSFLADAIVVVHLAYVSFIVVGLVLILLGAALRWSWIRNAWFRWSHLVAIVIVALEALAGIACPLTVWEDELRRLAGQDAKAGTFIERWVHPIMFFELPPQVFTTIYVLFALLVLATLWLVPPGRGRRRS